MKKTVIIAILLIYLGSIVLVNFFGLKVKNFEGTKYVENIDCEVVVRRDEDTDVRTAKDPVDTATTWHIFNFISGSYSPDELESNPNVVSLNYHVYPENADNRGVKLVYDKEAAAQICAVNETNMTLVFFASGGLTVEIVAADGSNIKETLFIYAKAS